MVSNLDQVFKKAELMNTRLLLGSNFALVDHDLNFLEFVGDVEEDERAPNDALGSNPPGQRDGLVRKLIVRLLLQELRDALPNGR